MSNPFEEGGLGYWLRVTENPKNTPNTQFMPPTFDEFIPGDLVKIELNSNDDTLFGFDTFTFNAWNSQEWTRSTGLRTESIGTSFTMNRDGIWTGVILKRETLNHTHAISAANLAIATRKSQYYVIEALISDGTTEDQVHIVRINSTSTTQNGLRISKWVYTRKPAV